MKKASLYNRTNGMYSKGEFFVRERTPYRWAPVITRRSLADILRSVSYETEWSSKFIQKDHTDIRHRLPWEFLE